MPDLDLDIERFWKDDELAQKDHCFNPASPQVAMGIQMENGCVFSELGEDGAEWGFTPRDRRIELNKRYNEKALKLVGRKLLAEDFPTDDMKLPEYRNIGEVFGGTYEFDGTTIWLESHMDGPEDLEKKLNWIDSLDKEAFRRFVLPANWDSEKKRIYETYGIKPSVFRGIRGPVTLACSVYGIENLTYLYYDDIDLYKRFASSITDVIFRYVELFDEEAGYAPGTAPHGFGVCDDNSCMMNPEMYGDFAYPILKAVFDRLSPDPDDWRYQHSDSAMGHNIPWLAKLNLTACNFGPTVSVSEIRKYMPSTCIEGVLAPFTFMRNDREGIRKEFLRDFEQIQEFGTKGLKFATAGSVNNGSSLESYRYIMALIQNYGRY